MDTLAEFTESPCYHADRRGFLVRLKVSGAQRRGSGWQSLAQGPLHLRRLHDARDRVDDSRGRHGRGLAGRAERARPPQGRLKLIKRGMDTKQVVARFEAERQALAMMDHPNVAKVFDAGATPGPALLRDGVRRGRADHRALRPARG